MNDENQKVNPNVSNQVSSVRRELETNSSAYISHSEQAPEIPKEVKEAGVEAVPHPELHTQTPSLVREYPEVAKALEEKSQRNLETIQQTAPVVKHSAKVGEIEDSYTWFQALVHKVRSKMNSLTPAAKGT